MKKNLFTFALLALFAMALSSCSRGHGCYYSSTEIKELDPLSSPQEHLMISSTEEAIADVEEVSTAE